LEKIGKQFSSMKRSYGTEYDDEMYEEEEGEREREEEEERARMLMLMKEDYPTKSEDIHTHPHAQQAKGGESVDSLVFPRDGSSTYPHTLTDTQTNPHPFQHEDTKEAFNDEGGDRSYVHNGGAGGGSNSVYMSAAGGDGDALPPLPSRPPLPPGSSSSLRRRPPPSLLSRYSTSMRQLTIDTTNASGHGHTHTHAHRGSGSGMSSAASTPRFGGGGGGGGREQMVLLQRVLETLERTEGRLARLEEVVMGGKEKGK
jgi:hypothetical protein